MVVRGKYAKIIRASIMPFLNGKGVEVGQSEFVYVHFLIISSLEWRVESKRPKLCQFVVGEIDVAILRESDFVPVGFIESAASYLNVVVRVSLHVDEEFECVVDTLFGIEAAVPQEDNVFHLFLRHAVEQEAQGAFEQCIS